VLGIGDVLLDVGVRVRHHGQREGQGAETAPPDRLSHVLHDCLLVGMASSASQWMNTPTHRNRLSASSAGIVPSSTQSATAIATACWAGPNICTACFAPLMVTLLNITVLGLVMRF